jgi:hypothetical protein
MLVLDHSVDVTVLAEMSTRHPEGPFFHHAASGSHRNGTDAGAAAARAACFAG